ncbi:MAG: UvrD-helicase domain-containing protein [Oscillospiraceae bacterium]|nr:UvrD-helicase domain-containing protein [Oscillospiraceae bacterium]
MSRWTPEQEAAIIARGASVVVSAAAGSGKTSVLTERVAELLADRDYPAEKMVVVTFTNDAAGEVRTRLNRKLSERILSDPENEWLRRQYTMLQSAHISTIHSFCFALMREQFAALDISAGFRLMDETEEPDLRAAAVSAVLEDFSSRAEQDDTVKAEQKLLFDAFCSGDDKPLEQLILSLYELTDNTPFGEYLMEDAAAAYESDIVRQQACAALSESLAEILMLYGKAAEYAAEIDSEKTVITLQDEITQIERVRDAVPSGDFAAVSKLLTAFKGGALRSLPRKDHQQEVACIKALRARGKELFDHLRDTWAIPLQYAPEDLPRHAQILRTLSGLVRAFSAELRTRKRERNALGFGDAMTMTLSLLAERKPDGSIVKTPLAEQLSQQYACIMIDEFQDSDNQQDLIFRMLSRGGDASKYGDNLFLVGDSKQCIYRFRNANPENFYHAMRAGAPYRSPQLTENTCIHLNRNFRSAQEVVDVVNHVFGMLMTEQVGEIRYDDTQKLVRGAEYPDARRPAEILLIPQNDPEAPDEAAAVAERIRQHLALKTPVRGTDGELRPCEPKDFLILMRASTRFPDYAAALTAAGIPVCSLEQNGYLQSPEIMLLLDILRAVDNPLLEIPVAAAMLSPMIGFTLDELVEIRLNERKGNLFRTMNAMRKAAESGEADADTPLMQKICAFLDFLESMRLYSAMDTPEQLIRRIYLQTDFLGLMQMTEGGARKKANLRALITYAHSFEENRGGGLSAFLRYLDAITERGGDLKGGGIPAGTENVVRLMTVHGSKGLEAPFVILADSAHRFSSEDAKRLYQHHSGTGIGFQLHDPETHSAGKSLPWVLIYEQNRRETRSEELRLLYVALTRAREYLILPLPYNNKTGANLTAIAAEQTAFGGQTDSLTRTAYSFSAWLFMTTVRNPACEQLRRTLGVECSSDPKQTFLPAVILDAPSAEPGAAADPGHDSTHDTADPQLLAALQQQCTWEYQSRLAGLTAKYGVSELAKAEDFSAPLRRPLFVREQHGLSGAERGTAVHTFMQYADFEKAAADVSAEADRLETLGRLTARQAQAVRKSTIGRFFTSELYAQIRQAKQVWREQKFTVRLSDLELAGPLKALGDAYAGTDGMLIGIMDLVFETTDGIVLVDYKTDRVPNAEALLEQYTEQIRLYAEALHLLKEKPVTACYLYSVTLNKTVPVTL